jgi:hypothetical protein
MKKYILIVITLSFVLEYKAQYTQFNEVQYISDDTGFLPFGSFEIDNRYLTFGTSLGSADCLENNLEGELIDYLTYFPPTSGLGAPGVGGNIVKINDSVNSVFYPIVVQSDCYGHKYPAINKFQNNQFVAQYLYPQINGPCEEYRENIPNIIFNYNDSTIAVISYYHDFIWHPLGFLIEDHLGYQLSTFNHNGELLNNYLHITPTLSVGITLAPEFNQCYRHHDYLIGIGEDISPFVMKMDLEGNLIDSLHFGLQLSRNDTGNGTLINDSTMLYIYSSGNDFIDMSESIAYTVHTTIININSFTVLQDQEIDLLYADQLQYAIGFRESVRGSNNEMVTAIEVIENPGFNPIHAVVCCINQQGEIQWQNEYFTELEDHVLRSFSDLILTTDDGYLLTGTINIPAGTDRITWLLKLDACGYEEPSDCPPVVSVADMEAPTSFQTWPNPFRNNLKAKLPANAKCVDWLDATGRLVQRENVYYPYQEWNLSALPIGVYHMQVLLEDRRVISQKVVKE